MYEDIKLDDFTKSYLSIALATSHHENTPLNELFDLYDIEENYLVQVKEDCLDFEVRFGGLLGKAYNTGYTAKEAGEDFWLSRNATNTGFELKGLGDIGTQLAQKAQEFGVSEAYKNEDDKIYFTNLPFDRKQLRLKF